MSTRQKKHAAELIGMFFLEHGGFMTEIEYKLAGKVPVRYALVKSLFGGWPRLISAIRFHFEPLYDEIKASSERSKVPPKPVPKPKIEERIEKKPADPLAELSAKTAKVEKPKDDE